MIMFRMLMNFQPILDRFIPNFTLKYEDLENIKADRVNTVIFNLHQTNSWAFFLGHPVYRETVKIIYLEVYLKARYLKVRVILVSKFLIYQTDLHNLKR